MPICEYSKNAVGVGVTTGFYGDGGEFSERLYNRKFILVSRSKATIVQYNFGNNNNGIDACGQEKTYKPAEVSPPAGPQITFFRERRGG